MPLHFCDSRGVCLKYKNRLLLLKVPDGYQAILLASNDFSTRSLSPRQAPHSLVALQGHHRFDQTFLTWCTKVEDGDGSILAPSGQIVLRFGHCKSLDLTLRIDLSGHNMLIGLLLSRIHMYIAFSVRDSLAIALLKTDQLLEAPL